MLFSSLTFLFGFLPIMILLYFIIKNRTYRNIVLCIFSMIFYAWGEPKYIILMLFSILFNYLMALLIDKSKKRKLIFALTIIINISLLFVFKYLDFGILSLNNIFNVNIPLSNIALPIGISFYTFQIMSYVIDVYKKEVKVQKNIINLATYIVLFPQLIAGPIVRYQTVADEIMNRKENLNDFICGVKRFVIGLSKKVLIANQMALIADIAFNNVGKYGSLFSWIGILAYTFQIFYDFSGYSSMAIGLGRMFGFHFLENFNYPYISLSVQDFWSRWHISLSTWFKDYVYIPLGGNRCSKIKWIRNFMIVWLLTGLWHGASWNYVLWGVFYGIILLLEKMYLSKYLNKLPKILRYLITMFVIMIGWTIFRADNIDILFSYIKSLFSFTKTDFLILVVDNFNILYLFLFFIPAIIFCFPIIPKLRVKYENKIWFVLLECLITGILFFLCISMLVSSTYNPFIYFKF